LINLLDLLLFSRFLHFQLNLWAYFLINFNIILDKILLRLILMLELIRIFFLVVLQMLSLIFILRSLLNIVVTLIIQAIRIIFLLLIVFIREIIIVLINLPMILIRVKIITKTWLILHIVIIVLLLLILLTILEIIVVWANQVWLMVVVRDHRRHLDINLLRNLNAYNLVCLWSHERRSIYLQLSWL
jgi:hypothetical protein